MINGRGRHFGRGTGAKRLAVATLCAVVLGGTAAGAATSPTLGATSPTPGASHESEGFHTHSGPDGEQDVNVCSFAVAPGVAHCLAHERTDGGAKHQRPAQPGTLHTAPAATVGNNGAYDSSYLLSAYNLKAASTGAGSGQTVAIVDAYDDPSASADLTQYRSFFGLTCPTGGNCLTKVDENGGTNYPPSDPGWSEEISLDLDMVSAVCANCRILLVEAASASFSDLATAVNTAVRMGANAVSNSYGGSEFLGENGYDSSYNHPGVAVTVSSGDSGYGVEYPAASKYVTAVGGTSLYQSTNTGSRNATETAWSGAGSGCSSYEGKPAWQADGGCANRTVADVSAVADPNTGVWVYDTYGTGGSWLIFGGTSVASPIIATVYALAGNASSSNTLAQYPYANGGLNDITSGSNGSCSPAYLCSAGQGYDGPTGLGTPNGTAGFSGTVQPPPPPPTVPGAPTALAATAGNAQVSLTWSAPSSNGGATITQYDVYRWAQASPTPQHVGTSTSTSYTDTLLTNGTTYSYYVTAVNSAGEGGQSNQVSATPVATTVPGAPRNLTAYSSRYRGVRLYWSAPSSNGGSAITGYVVYRGTASGQETVLRNVSCTSSQCSFSDQNTSHNVVYYYEVAATNAVGTGPVSNQASAKAT